MRAKYPEDKIPFAVRIAAFALFGLTSLASLLALIYAVINRRYPPLKARHINLVILYYIGSFLWCLGDLQIIGFFGYNGVWSYCILWRSWIRDIFGSSLIIGIINYRCYILYVVLVCGRSFAEAPKLLPIICYYVPYIALALMGLLQSDFVMEKPEDGYYCSVRAWYKIAFDTITLASIALAAYMSYLVRNIRRSFNQHRFHVYGLSLVVFDFIISVALRISPLESSFICKLFVFLFNLFTANVYFWFLIGGAVRGCLLYREAYLQQFINDLLSENTGTLPMSPMRADQLGKHEQYRPGEVVSSPVVIATNEVVQHHRHSLSHHGVEAPQRVFLPYQFPSANSRSEPDFRSALVFTGVYAGR